MLSVIDKWACMHARPHASTCQNMRTHACTRTHTIPAKTTTKSLNLLVKS